MDPLTNDEISTTIKFRLSQFEGAAKRGKEEKSKISAPDTAEKFVSKTKAGDKKDVSGELPDKYDPQQVEDAWYAWWEKSKFFHADAKKALEPNAKKFTMMLPPPNVTGALHLGHALMLAIEDVMTRWKIMQGYVTEWLPGMDHAGISCQNVVENKIWKESKQTRHDLGRDDFVKAVMNWKDEYGGKINNQIRRYGCALDWDRFAFTLDPPQVKAVTEAFV